MRITQHRVDSPLGRWIHSECRSAHLMGVVERLWHFEGVMALGRERSFPGGHFDVILHLGPRFMSVDSNGHAGRTFPRACIVGPQSGPTVIESPAGRICILGIRFHARGAYRLFGAAIAPVAGLSVDLSDLDAGASTLAERCGSVSSVRDRFAIVVGWLDEQLRVSRTPHAAIWRALGAIDQARGRCLIDTVQRDSGLGRSRFFELFRSHIGVSAKYYSRLVRFNHALHGLRGGTSLSRAAYAAGYADQAHMGNEFRELAGMSPREFARKLSYPETMSVPESRGNGIAT